ncbi:MULTISPECIES: DUF2273 domain-containing protein [unclassified Enterococcus]|uniref:DUF2273 domain-containing protein n=1 Tax=unclassified Enterococcus TaxID=2608891 RepID=UPI00155799F4|nr:MULTISPECIES: DUF2273 domain-containing protein [unclassified Enterococcus]MBS7576926.1 DUF2273 domain-containing protein [Enterococcus sp. MMGLQ5-2]MBS7584333.1 DUF2273 domain-containing protein [Enterococcus sp. MMGLQ5-1]NPD12189.1 DUF2273 domain-containing protein [Enterococcus sp. MMGLQ5-1]NPD36761.1 DUF2273 domain-containing protein [Enterococcus sp. MMGLQ5-2]
MQKILLENILPITGGIFGLVLAILFFTFGFFKTIIVIILIVLGVLFGLYVKRSDLLGKYFPDK